MCGLYGGNVVLESRRTVDLVPVKPIELVIHWTIVIIPGDANGLRLAFRTRPIFTMDVRDSPIRVALPTKPYSVVVAVEPSQAFVHGKLDVLDVANISIRITKYFFNHN